MNELTDANLCWMNGRSGFALWPTPAQRSGGRQRLGTRSAGFDRFGGVLCSRNDPHKKTTR